MLLAPVGLSLAGFTAAGPAAGSLAAGWMSAIAITKGGVAAGSLYAYLQSLAMGGAALPTGALAAGGGGAYVTMTAAVAGARKAVAGLWGFRRRPAAAATNSSKAGTRAGPTGRTRA